MSENVTNELLLEHLKAIQAKLVEHDGRFTALENRLTAVEGHVATLVQRDMGRNVEFAELTSRVERIERRLDLADAPTG